VVKLGSKPRLIRSVLCLVSLVINSNNTQRCPMALPAKLVTYFEITLQAMQTLSATWHTTNTRSNSARESWMKTGALEVTRYKSINQSRFF